MKKILNKLIGTDVAVCICGILSAGSIVLAFFGSERSIKLMSTPPALGFSALVALLLVVRGIMTLFRKRFDSALLHLGCACVVCGWLWGQVEPKFVKDALPLKGSMALVDGDVMNALWEGAYLTNYVGRLPFTVKLDKFIINYYESSDQDQSNGRMPPIKEYRSRVTISEPDKKSYVKNIIVNYPVYVGGYYIYQMSWGQSQNRWGQPVTYTVLQFIRDPGLRAVYAGYVMLFVGTLLFAIKLFRVKMPVLSVNQEVK